MHPNKMENLSSCILLIRRLLVVFTLYLCCTKFLDKTIQLVALRAFKSSTRPSCTNFKQCNDWEELKRNPNTSHTTIQNWYLSCSVLGKYSSWHLTNCDLIARLLLYPVVQKFCRCHHRSSSSRTCVHSQKFLRTEIVCCSAWRT
jgi:hypothetical protein